MPDLSAYPSLLAFLTLDWNKLHIYYLAGLVVCWLFLYIKSQLRPANRIQSKDEASSPNENHASIDLRQLLGILIYALTVGLCVSLTLSTLLENSELVPNDLQFVTSGKNLLSPSTAGYLDNLRAEWGIRGVSIAVVRREEDGEWSTMTVGLGRASGKMRDGVTDSTLFSLASNSKLFTSLSTGLALTESNLTWHAHVSSVLPHFHLQDKEAEHEVTFVELLSHQTGLPRHDLSPSINTSIEQIIENLPTLKPSVPFRSKWQYNNLAYLIASHLPVHLLGIDFDEFVKNRIWEPLGMKTTFYNIHDARATGKLSTGYGRSLTPDRNVFLDVAACRLYLQRGRKLGTKCRGSRQDLGWFQTEWKGNAGAGGVISCAKDMKVWVQTLLLNGTHPKTMEQVIPASLLQDVVRPQIASTEKHLDPELTTPYYGFGQSTYKYRGYTVIEHGGNVPGQNSQVIRLPGEMLGVVIMVNDEELGTLYHEVAKWRIIDELLQLKPIDWKTRKVNKLLDESEPKTLVVRPARPFPPPDNIKGTYAHPAYGRITLRLVRSAPTTTFLADIEKVWASQFVFHHFDGQAFNITAKLIMPETKAILWNVNGPGIQARIGEGGLGLQGIWGAGEGVADGHMDKDGIRNGLEVFFARV